MKRFFLSSIILQLWIIPLKETKAQGTLRFSNLGGGVHSPVFDFEGELLGSGYSAWLALSSGIVIAGPTPFIANGLFSGSLATVPGIPPGETVEIALIVSSSSGEIVGTSNNFEVVLGGLGTPPSLPANLTGLKPFIIKPPTSYYWELDITGWRCGLRSNILMFIEVDHSFCEAEEESENISSVSSSAINLEYSLLSDGQLRISWLAGTPMLLFGANSLDRSEGVRISGDVYQDGYRVLTVKASEPKKFYWLAELDQGDESN